MHVVVYVDFSGAGGAVAVEELVLFAATLATPPAVAVGAADVAPEGGSERLRWCRGHEPMRLVFWADEAQVVGILGTVVIVHRVVRCGGGAPLSSCFQFFRFSECWSQFYSGNLARGVLVIIFHLTLLGVLLE